MKLKYLVAASPFLREISNLSIPNIKDSYKFGLFLNKVDPYLKVYSDSYGKLVKKYAGPDSVEAQIKISESSKEAFAAELSELGNEEIDVVCPMLDVSIYETVDCRPSLFYRLFGIIFKPLEATLENTIDVTKSQAYDAFGALTSIGSNLMKGKVQQKLIQAGESLFSILEKCDEEQEELRKVKDANLQDFFKETITVHYNKFKLDELVGAQAPANLAKVPWMIEE